MKKKLLILLLIAVLIPVPSQQIDDGGTRFYTAVLYRITQYHHLATEDGVRGHSVGFGVKILGFDVYEHLEFVPSE